MKIFKQNLVSLFHHTTYIHIKAIKVVILTTFVILVLRAFKGIENLILNG